MKTTGIILAAGKGTRLWPLTKDKPKPLIDLGDGTTILERQLSVLLDFGDIESVLVVVGYLGEMIENKIAEMGLSDRVFTVYNPFYEMSNNLISLWLGLIHSRNSSSILITNGDNLFKHNLIQTLLETPEGIHLAVDEKEEYDSDDMKVEIVEGRITWVSKEIPYNRISAESTGISILNGRNSVGEFVSAANKLIKNKEYLNRFWLEIFNELARQGKKVNPLFIDKSLWQEMDIHSDRKLIEYLLNEKKWVD